MEHNLDLSAVPGKPVLVGVGGSHAYGLATVDSDVDYRGCYVAPTREFFHLRQPVETYDRHDPDCALHEVGKLLRLAAAANPTVLEVFYYSEYAIRDDIGDLLIENRDLFITGKIRDTHVGYARSQFERLKRREGSFSSDTAKRTAKHARHLLRLVRQAERALTTGTFDIAALDREEIFAFGEMEHAEMCRKAEREIERVKAIPSVLPPEPDLKKIDDLLVEIREVGLLWR
jgi:predicted nucleotidyltransferase